jgi:hypothetical protein
MRSERQCVQFLPLQKRFSDHETDEMAQAEADQKSKTDPENSFSVSTFGFGEALAIFLSVCRLGR